MEVCEQNYAKAGNKRTVTKIKNPPRETMIHAAIYNARPEVNSVVHTHQTLATAFSVAGTPILPIYNQAAVFAPETPIFPSPRLDLHDPRRQRNLPNLAGPYRDVAQRPRHSCVSAIAWNMLPFMQFIWSGPPICSSSRAASASRQSCRKQKSTT